jgi:hypothetical protein
MLTQVLHLRNGLTVPCGQRPSGRADLAGKVEGETGTGTAGRDYYRARRADGG